MSTLTWPIVQSWIERNPFQTAALSPFQHPDTLAHLVADHETEYGMVRLPVSPATPLSAVLLAQDSMYAASSPNSRRAMLRDELTDLQEKACLHLKGRAWPVRKTAEGLAAVGLEEGRASVWPALGWRALCALRECQLVLVNKDKKQIQFYPEDVRTWSSEIPTLLVEFESRFIWSGTWSVGAWLSDREHDSWTVEWPLADGSMEELKALAEKHHESTEKRNKEALRKRVGRAQSVSTLAQWSKN